MPLLPPLSVVIPAYNEGRRIGPSLQKIGDYLDRRVAAYEVIVIDDGSTDDTVAAVEAMARRWGRIRVISSPNNRGKGHAVRTGMLAAGHDLILTTDADLSTPINEVEKLLARLEGADVVIGSRTAAGADLQRRQSFLRRQLGKTFNRVLRGLRLTRFHDTQCGFKIWRSAAAREVFRRCRVDGFSYDVEALVLAERLGYRIAEVGVVWINDSASKVRILRDSSRMLIEAFGILLRIKFLRRY